MPKVVKKIVARYKMPTGTERAAAGAPAPKRAKTTVAARKFAAAGNKQRTRAAQAKPKTAAKKMTQREAVEYLSPFNKNFPPMNPNSLGLGLVVSDFTRAPFSTSQTHKVILIYNPSCRGALQTGAWNASTGVSYAGGGSIGGLSPTFKYSSADAPLQLKPLRAGMRIKNLAPQIAREGSITVLQTASPVDIQFVPLSYDINLATAQALVTAVETNPKSRQYTAEQLSTGNNELVSFPASSSAYNSYGKKFNPGFASGDQASTWAEAIEDQSMSVTMIVFDVTPTAAQVYTLEFMGQSSLRYPQDTILGALQKPLGGIGTQAVVSEIHTAVAENGSNIVPMQH
mgnify:CR=1 FL=1